MKIALSLALTAPAQAPLHDGLNLDFLERRFHARAPGASPLRTTVAQDLLTWSSSAKWTRSAAGVMTLQPANAPAYEYDEGGAALGALIEGARTNACLWSDDLTNAAWVKTNLSAAKTATGADGAANGATIVTATAANATALQAFTAASATRQYGVWIKRRTGVGGIDLTVDGGATWTPVTAGAAWAQAGVNQAAVTNPSIGLRLQTSGDAIDVQYNQLENGAAFTSSPIPTTTAPVTRNADSVTRTNGGELTNGAFTVFWQGVARSAWTSSGNALWQMDNGVFNGNSSYVDKQGGAAAARNLTYVSGVLQTASAIVNTLTAGATGKHVYARSAAAGSYHKLNGGAAATLGAGLSMPGAFTRMLIPSGVDHYWMQKLIVWTERKSNADLAAITA